MMTAFTLDGILHTVNINLDGKIDLAIFRFHFFYLSSAELSTVCTCWKYFCLSHPPIWADQKTTVAALVCSKITCHPRFADLLTSLWWLTNVRFIKNWTSYSTVSLTTVVCPDFFETDVRNHFESFTFFGLFLNNPILHECKSCAIQKIGTMYFVNMVFIRRLMWICVICMTPQNFCCIMACKLYSWKSVYGVIPWTRWLFK